MARFEDGKMYAGFWWGNVKENVHVEDPGVGGRIILKWIFKKWNGDWNDVAQDRDKWRAVMNAVMNIQVP